MLHQVSDLLPSSLKLDWLDSINVSLGKGFTDHINLLLRHPQSLSIVSNLARIDIQLSVRDDPRWRSEMYHHDIRAFLAVFAQQLRTSDRISTILISRYERCTGAWVIKDLLQTFSNVFKKVFVYCSRHVDFVRDLEVLGCSSTGRDALSVHLDVTACDPARCSDLQVPCHD